MSAPEWFDVAAQLFTIAAILVLMWLITRMQKMCDQLIADSLRDLAEITRLRLALVRAGERFVANMELYRRGEALSALVDYDRGY